jgi:hypothetical protein
MMATDLVIAEIRRLADWSRNNDSAWRRLRLGIISRDEALKAGEPFVVNSVADMEIDDDRDGKRGPRVARTIEYGSISYKHSV